MEKKAPKEEEMEEEEEEVEEEEAEEEEESSHSSPRSKQSKSKSKSKSKSDKQSESKTQSKPIVDPSEHYESSLTTIAVNCEKIIENPSTGVVRSHRQPSLLSQVLAFLKDRDARLRRIALLSLLKVFNDILPVPSFPRESPRRTTPSASPPPKKKPACTSAKSGKSDNTRKVSWPPTPYCLTKRSFRLVLRENTDEMGAEPRFRGVNETPGVTLHVRIAEESLPIQPRGHAQQGHHSLRSLLVLPREWTNRRNAETGEIVHDCFREVFRGDAQGQVTFSIVRQLAEKMKAKNYHVSPKTVQMWR